MALALTAAGAKGVSLSPEALRRYAAAIDPGLRAPGDEPGGLPPPGEGRDFPEKAAAFLRDILQNPPEQQAGENTLLSLLNRLPGKNGARWAVYPYRFSAENIAMALSLRLLFIQEPSSGPLPAERVARIGADITVGPPGGDGVAAGTEGRWLFVIDNPGSSGASARIYPDPAPPEERRKALEQRARSALGGFAGNLRIGTEFPAFADALDTASFRVDQEV